MVRIVAPPSFCPNCQSSHVLQWGMLNVDPWSGEGGPAPTLCSDNENYFTAWLAVCNLIWATITRFMCFTTSIMHRTQTTARSTDEWGMISQPNTSSLSKTCLPVFPPPPNLANLMSGKLTHCYSWTLKPLKSSPELWLKLCLKHLWRQCRAAVYQNIHCSQSG